MEILPENIKEIPTAKKLHGQTYHRYQGRRKTCSVLHQQSGVHQIKKPHATLPHCDLECVQFRMLLRCQNTTFSVHRNGLA